MFISYTWKDGRTYAEALEKKLKDRRYRCFLDSSEYQAGDDLNRDARRAVKCSRALAIVVSEHALASKHVRKEISLFDLSQKPVVPIDIHNSLYEKASAPDGGFVYQVSSRYHKLCKNSDEKQRKEMAETFGLINRDVKLQIEEPQIEEPSSDTVHKLCERFNFTRSVSRRLRAIGVTCIILVLLAVLAIISRNEAELQRDHAEQNLAEAIGVAQTITEQIDHDLKDLPGAESVRDKLLGSAYDMLEDLLERAPEHPQIIAAQADAAINMGSWNFRHDRLAVAKKQFEEALEQYRENPAKKNGQIQCLLNLGRTNRDLQLFDEARGNYDQVLALVTSSQPTRQEIHFKARALYGHGDLFHDQADLKQALEYHLEAEKLHRVLVESQPSPPEAKVHFDALLDLGSSLDRVAHLYDQGGDLDQALRYHIEIYKIANLLLSARPGNGQYRRDFALAASRLGYDFQRKGDLSKALRYYQEGESMLQSLVALAPGSKTYRYDWAIALTDLGDLYTTTEDYPDATKFYQESLRELDNVIKIDFKNPKFLGQKMVTVNSLAEMYKASGNLKEAIKQYESALEIADEKIRRWPNVPNQYYAKAVILNNMSEAFHKANPSASLEYRERACEELEKLVERYPNDQRYRSMLDSVESAE
mgnify:CR=1 FL=1